MEDLYSYLDGSATDYSTPETVSPGTSVSLPVAGTNSTGTTSGWASSLFGFLGGLVPVAGQVLTGQQQSDATTAAARLNAAATAKSSSNTTLIVVIVAAVAGLLGLVMFLRRK